LLLSKRCQNLKNLVSAFAAVTKENLLVVNSRLLLACEGYKRKLSFLRNRREEKVFLYFSWAQVASFTS
jgi:hypothetical protein